MGSFKISFSFLFKVRPTNQQRNYSRVYTRANRLIPQKQSGNKKSKPARILRPGAETKVGGSPVTTMGFKAL